MNVTLQRKKSLPDVQQIPVNSMMSREEVSVLGSARREEVRRQKDESERYKVSIKFNFRSRSDKIFRIEE